MAIKVFGAATSLETILDAIAEKVGDDGDELFPDERVLITVAPDLDFEDGPIDEKWLVISPHEFSAIDSMVSGGGNYKAGTVGTIGIDLWNRYEVDETLRDREALRDATNGILAVWKSVMTSLQLHSPENDDDECILIEPMRWKSWTVQPRRPKSPWLQIKSFWEIKFVQDLT